MKLLLDQVKILHRAKLVVEDQNPKVAPDVSPSLWVRDCAQVLYEPLCRLHVKLDFGEGMIALVNKDCPKDKVVRQL